MQAESRKVVLAVPTTSRPYQQCIDSIEASIAPIKAAGWTLCAITEIGNPYISAARSTMLRKAQAANADVVVFIDHDLSFPPDALLRLIETEGNVVAGTYRFKREPEEYMGALQPDIAGNPQVRADGCVKAYCIPAGFLKVTKEAVGRFMLAYPELMYLDKGILTVDLFNHGAHKGVWYGEDYAFSRNWLATGGEIWIVPDLDLTHWAGEWPFPGNFHRYLRGQPGGSESDSPEPPPHLKEAWERQQAAA